jgi:hypothetical protein
MTSIAILEAVNTSYVPFNGQQVITVVAAGVTYVAMRQIVENIGIDWTGQSVKLRNVKDKFNCRDISMVAADGKIRKLLCLPLKKLNGWLFSINPEKVRADIRDKLIQYQEECFTVLHDYWNKGFASRSTPETTVDYRTPLRGIVNRIMGKYGMTYQAVYKLIHKEFGVKHIDELTQKQTTEAVEYLATKVIEGEFVGKQLEPPVAQKPFTDGEICSLAWLWMLADKMRSHAEITYPALRQLESRHAGEAYDLAKEFKYWLNETMSVLVRETAHITPDTKVACIEPLNFLRRNQWRTALTAPNR